MDVLESGEVECSDYTDGRRSPLEVPSIWGWKPVWGRRDQAAYWAGVPVMIAGLFLVRFHSLWFMSVFGWPGGAFVMAGLVVVAPLFVGWYAVRKGWRARNFRRAVRERAPRSWAVSCRSLSGAGAVRREPRFCVAGYCWRGRVPSSSRARSADVSGVAPGSDKEL